MNAQGREDNMTLTWKFCSVLSAAIMLACPGETGHLPPPTELTYTWPDLLTVSVSWKEPGGLPDGCEIEYEYKLLDSEKREIELPKRTADRNFQENLLTEDFESARWTCSIRAIGSLSCEGWNSMAVTKTIEPQKPKAKLVEDFKCYIYNFRMDCSWKPVNPSLDLSLSYRMCGINTEPIKLCNQTYSSGERNVCHMDDNYVQKEMCMVAATEAGLSTFEIEFAVTSPKMSISEIGSNLELRFEEFAVQTSCWIYNVCYTECYEPKTCQQSSVNPIKVPYDNRCRYEFQYEVKTDGRNCRTIRSDWSDVVTYGTNKPDTTLTVVSIVVPVILSACVILSCLCFRRHSDIICPTIPDPSAIFKEMMMSNGNKQLKPPTSLLYSPEEEEQCTVTLVAEDAALHQNS